MKKIFVRLVITMITGAWAASAARAQDAQQPGLQQQNPKFIIGLTGGVSVPMGNFAKDDYYNSSSGFAGTGGNCGITATYFINRHWGIAETFSYQQFAFIGGNNMALGMQGFPDGFDVDSVTFSVKGNNHTFSFLLGPVYSMQAGKRLSVDLRLLVGFVNAGLAGNTFIVTDGGVTDPPFYQAVSWASTLGGQLGAALRYAISRHFAASLSADYFYSKPDFTVNNVNRNNSAGREIYTYNQPVQGINGNLSIYYVLNRK